MTRTDDSIGPQLLKQLPSMSVFCTGLGTAGMHSPKQMKPQYERLTDRRGRYYDRHRIILETEKGIHRSNRVREV